MLFDEEHQENVPGRLTEKSRAEDRVPLASVGKLLAYSLDEGLTDHRFGRVALDDRCPAQESEDFSPFTFAEDDSARFQIRMGTVVTHRGTISR